MKNILLAGRIKELRIKQNLSQEELSETTGLSLRTIQRIENGETEPRGDSLKRLAAAFGVSATEINNLKTIDDKAVLKVLNISQFGFLVFPLLGIIIPWAIWILKKETIKNVNNIGKEILNFQITWTLLLVLFYFLIFSRFLFHIDFPIPFINEIFMIMNLLFYLFNILIIGINTTKCFRTIEYHYRPAFRFLS